MLPRIELTEKITLIICETQSWTSDKGILQAPGAYQNFLSFFLGRGGRRPSPVGGRPELARQRPGPPERWKENRQRGRRELLFVFRKGFSSLESLAWRRMWPKYGALRKGEVSHLLST